MFTRLGNFVEILQDYSVEVEMVNQFLDFKIVSNSGAILFFLFTFEKASGDKKEYLYKILVIGELGTGKTSLIKRYVHNLYSPNYRATVRIKIEHIQHGFFFGVAIQPVSSWFEASGQGSFLG